MSFLRGYNTLPHHLTCPIRPFIRDSPSLPFDVLSLILQYPLPLSTLLALASLSKEIYDLVIDRIYTSVRIHKDNIESLFWGIKELERPKVGPGSFRYIPPCEVVGTINDMNDRYSVLRTVDSTLSGMESAGYGAGSISRGYNPRKSLNTKYSPSGRGGDMVGPNEETEKRKIGNLGRVREMTILDVPNTQSIQLLAQLFPTHEGLLGSIERINVNLKMIRTFVQYRSSHNGRSHDYLVIVNKLLRKSHSHRNGSRLTINIRNSLRDMPMGVRYREDDLLGYVDRGDVEWVMERLMDGVGDYTVCWEH
ncbi:hypothetical protein I302_105007 [Kwoniella bestiolae CBS 10118]|uniref:F-box domain-containing protein n=1 Tax=Kwoniella bestiolae CBS 10118 TaxID=1296100 RepID=A0A1B9FR49_9TREE|nr:hypothetical protein I302_08920 [Kwoniella bestiolae CBS 10118]OCF21248.1 hypothetical protein I302_08920 [Kwoniella bestiolae CBS 10118]